jgi:hypothetical protein
MHFKDFFDSKYLNAADVGEGPHVVQIVRVESELLQDGTKKPALHPGGKSRCSATRPMR